MYESVDFFIFGCTDNKSNVILLIISAATLTRGSSMRQTDKCI